MLDQAGDLLLVRVDSHAFDLVGADGADRCRRVSGQEPVERDDTDQVIVVVHDIQIEGAFARRRLADVLDRLGHGRVLAHRDELGRHEASGGALGIFEELLDLLGLLLLHELEDFVRSLLRQLLHDVDDLLGRHAVEDARDLDLRERADQLAQGRIVELGEHLARVLRAEQAEEAHLIVARQLADHARHVGGVGVLDEVGEPLVPAFDEQLLDRFPQPLELFHDS